MKKLLVLFTILLSVTLAAQENLNIVFYNVLNYPQALSSSRDQNLIALLEGMRPDIFTICKLESKNAGNNILNSSLNASTNGFESASYLHNTSSDVNLQRLVCFDKNKFELSKSAIIPTTVRDINPYKRKLRTKEELSTEAFVSHLKASQEEDREATRLSMVEEFTAYLETIDTSISVLFTGDLNFYSSTKPVYQELLDSSNNAVLVNPTIST